MDDQGNNRQAGSRRGNRLGAMLALSLGAHLLVLWLLASDLPTQSPMPTLSLSFQPPATAGSTPTDESPVPEPRRETQGVEPADSAIASTAPEPEHRATRTERPEQQSQTADGQRSEPQAMPRETRPGDARVDRAAVENRVMEALQARFSYPALARRRGWEGRVLLRLDLDASGRIDRLEVEHSSGYRMLDRAALEALRRLAGQAPLADGLNQPLEGLRIPVVYRLQG